MYLYIYFFIKGFIAGGTIAAIGGPVGLLCLRRSITQGQSAGVAIGIGAALADALFGAIAGFGLTFISDLLLLHQKSIGLLGSAILLLMGIATWLEKPVLTFDEDKKPTNIFANIATSFFITLTNPATILFFAAISVSLGIDINNYSAAIIMVFGIFLGSLCWFSLLAYLVTKFHLNITPHRLTIINRLLSIGLILFGILVLIKNIVK